MRSTRSHNQQPRSAKTISDQCNETLREGLYPLCGCENALWKMPRVRNQKQASNRQKRWAIADKHTTLNESKVTRNHLFAHSPDRDNDSCHHTCTWCVVVRMSARWNSSNLSHFLSDFVPNLCPLKDTDDWAWKVREDVVIAARSRYNRMSFALNNTKTNR